MTREINYDKRKYHSDEKIINFSKYKIKIIKIIGQGAYSYVYSGMDLNEKRNYAIKQVSVHDDKYRTVLKTEIDILKKLKNSPYIVQYYDDIRTDQIHFILLEYCPLSLLQFMQKRDFITFEEAELIKLFGQITRAVSYMHNLTPPLINRDLKVDNILLSETFHIRLCDFGSVTIKKINPSKLDHTQKCQLEEKLQEATTPLYRAPEMLDFYLNYIIDEKVDIWALGCVFYFVCFCSYPFEEGARLAILNLNYKKIKSTSRVIESLLNPLISRIFVIDPSQRPTSSDIYRELEFAAREIGIAIGDPVLNIAAVKKISLPPTQIVFDVMSKAGSLFETLKETGQKIKAQIKYSTIKKSKSPCDLFTSRIAVASFPMISNNANKLSAEYLAEYLITNYPSCFVIINLINSVEYPISLFENRVVTFSLIDCQAPELSLLLDIIKRVLKFLASNNKRIVVFHDNESGYLSYYIISLLLIYTQAFSNFEQLFERILISTSAFKNIAVSPAHASFLRYGNYIESLSNNPGFNLLGSPVQFKRMTICPVVLCNRSRTGCRPFITISIDGNVVYSTLNNPLMLKEYHESDAKIEIPLDALGYGNVMVTFYHASIIDDEFFQKKIFSFQFHTAFLKKQTVLKLIGPQLDIFSASFFTSLYTTQVEIHVMGTVETQFQPPDLKKNLSSVSPSVLFTNNSDYEQLLQKYNQINTKNFIDHRISSLITLSEPLADYEHAENVVTKQSHLDSESTIFTDTSLNMKPTYSYKREMIDTFPAPKIENLLVDFSFQPLVEEATPSNPFEILEDTYTSAKDSTVPDDDHLISFDHSHTNARNSGSISNKIAQNDVFSNFQHISSNPLLEPHKILAQENFNASSPMILSDMIDFSRSPPSCKSSDSLKQTSSASSSNQKNSHVSYGLPSATQDPNDFFDDILLNQGFSKAENYTFTTPTLNEHKKLQQEILNKDPVAKLIKSWCNGIGKTKNITSLLTTLHTIIWCPNKWIPVSIRDLTDYNSVKRCYRKACILVHPDKHIGSQYENLAKAIFCELNEAWSFFESTGGKIYT